MLMMLYFLFPHHATQKERGKEKEARMSLQKERYL